MHRLLKLTSLLLCFELILGPVAPGFSFVSKAMAQDCPGGTQFDSTLNRCITTEQMANIMNATSNCSPSDKECYKANAERALKEGEEEGKIKEQLANKGGLMGTGMKAAAVAVPLFMVASRMFKGKSKKPSKCRSLSLYMMLGGGAAIFLGDMWANSKHKKRLKKIKEEWEGIRKGEKSEDKGSGDSESHVSSASLAQTSTDPDMRNAKAKESQAEAFEMLAKSEDSLASAAKFKSTVYAVGALAFAGASVISFMEVFKLKTKKAAILAAQKAVPVSAQAVHAAQVDYTKYYQEVHCTNSTPKDGIDPDSPVPGEAGEAQQPSTDRISPEEFEQEMELRRQNGTDGIVYQNSSDFKIFESLNSIKSLESAIYSSSDIASIFTLTNNLEQSILKRQSPSIEDYEKNREILQIYGGEVNRNIDLLSAVKVFSLKLLSELVPVSSSFATENQVGDLAKNKATEAGMNKMLSGPLTRGIIGGVFAAWSGLMFMHAKKQASISKARAKYLRDRKDEFNDATGAISCTSADRNNVNNLKCYCYTSSGQRNSQRSNSQACIALFTGRNITGETNYLNGTGIASQKVCMTNAGIDENCACRTNNTCLSAVPTNFSGINPGTLGLISSSTSPLNQLTSGQIAAGSVNGAAAVSNALKLLDQAKKSQAKVPELANGKGDKLARDMAGSLIASSAGGSAPQLSSPSSGNPFSLSPSQAAASLEKEFKDAETGVASVKSGGFVPQPGAGKVDDFGLEFGMTPTQLAADQNTLSQMNQNLDFGQNDINNSSTTNLFEVLSNRYQRSGMRRLFDDEGRMAADPAAKTDITE